MSASQLIFIKYIFHIRRITKDIENQTKKCFFFWDVKSFQANEFGSPASTSPNSRSHINVY